MQVTVHVYDTASHIDGNWYWIIRLVDERDPIIDDILSMRNYKSKHGALKSARNFAKKHNFEIVKEFENE